MDHRHLNKEVPEFASQIPTTENLAIAIWKRLSSATAGRAAASRARLRAARPVCRFLRRAMKAHLTRRYIFSASHRLHCEKLTKNRTARFTANATTLMGTATTTLSK